MMEEYGNEREVRKNIRIKYVFLSSKKLNSTINTLLYINLVDSAVRITRAAYVTKSILRTYIRSDLP